MLWGYMNKVGFLGDSQGVVGIPNTKDDLIDRRLVTDSPKKDLGVVTGSIAGHVLASVIDKKHLSGVDSAAYLTKGYNRIDDIKVPKTKAFGKSGRTSGVAAAISTLASAIPIAYFLYNNNKRKKYLKKYLDDKGVSYDNRSVNRQVRKDRGAVFTKKYIKKYFKKLVQDTPFEHNNIIKTSGGIMDNAIFEKIAKKAYTEEVLKLDVSPEIVAKRLVETNALNTAGRKAVDILGTVLLGPLSAISRMKRDIIRRRSYKDLLLDRGIDANSKDITYLMKKDQRYYKSHKKSVLDAVNKIKHG